MLARAHTFTIDGLESRRVSVEIDVRQGLPSFNVVGLADASVREARERVRTAIRNSGYEFPAKRITANLAPGDLRKAGPGLDLALACAVLAASGQVPRERLAEVALFGELGLDGTVHASRGTLAVALAARRAGLRSIVLASVCAREAALVKGLEVLGVQRLRSATRVLAGGSGDPMPASPRAAPAPERRGPDLADVHGQVHAVRALVIAAAGGHNMLVSGPPGSGKTMLAQRLPSIVPALAAGEAIEVARIRSLAGIGSEQLSRARPFRAPHHSISAAGLVGTAGRGAVGEAVLAHNGVLFLDELSEFSRAALDSLRQPLEEGRVAVARARDGAAYPARFMLFAAMNPCPCGYATELERCRCSASELARYRRQLGGPLLDRLDLLVAMDDELEARPRSSLDSRAARRIVREARERQARRLAGTGAALNAHMDLTALRAHVRLDEPSERVLVQARQQGLISARGEHRVLRVARTIADLERCARVHSKHVQGALALRVAHPYARRRGS